MIPLPPRGPAPRALAGIWLTVAAPGTELGVSGLWTVPVRRSGWRMSHARGPARAPRGGLSLSAWTRGRGQGPHGSDRPSRGRALPRGVPDAHPDGGGGRPSGERPEPRERAGPRAGRAPGRGSRGGGAPARAPNGPGCSREVTAAARGSVEAPPPSPVPSGRLERAKKKKRRPRRPGTHRRPSRHSSPASMRRTPPPLSPRAGEPGRRRRRAQP